MDDQERISNFLSDKSIVTNQITPQHLHKTDY